MARGLQAPTGLHLAASGSAWSPGEAEYQDVSLRLARYHTVGLQLIDQSQNFGFTVSHLRNTMSPQLQSRDRALIESKHYMWRLCPEILVNPSGFLSSAIYSEVQCL